MYAVRWIKEPYSNLPGYNNLYNKTLYIQMINFDNVLFYLRHVRISWLNSILKIHDSSIIKKKNSYLYIIKFKCFNL